MDHYPDCKMKFAPVDACGCMARKVEELENKLDSKNVCKHCPAISLLKDVVPHIKRGRKYSEGKTAKFVDLTLPRYVADKILELVKRCKNSGL